MDKSLLALMKVEELEELIKKGKGSKVDIEQEPPQQETPPIVSDEDGFIDKSSLNQVLFNDYTDTKAFSISTDGYDFGFGQNTYFITGKLSSTVATAYEIEIYVNGYLNNKINLTSQTTIHDCQFMITTCNYSQETFVMLRIIPKTLDGNTITASGFVLKTKDATNLIPTFKTPSDLGRNDNKIKFTVMDGIDSTGAIQQKYGFAVLEDGKIYAGECNKENFAYENCNYLREISTYTDKGIDFTTTYYVKPETSTSAHAYWYHVLYYSDSTLAATAVYKNLSLDGSLVSIYKSHSSWHMTPAVDSTKKAYTKSLSIASTEINFGYTTTNGIVSSSNFYRKTTPFQNFECGALPIARSLEQTTYLMPCFLLKENKLYFFIESIVTEPTLVDNISDNIDRVTHAVFDGSENKILLYYRSNGFLKCYHISKLSNGYYQGDYTEVISYGMSEYFPLIGNDAVFLYGDKIFFTNKADKLWLST